MKIIRKAEAEDNFKYSLESNFTNSLPISFVDFFPIMQTELWNSALYFSIPDSIEKNLNYQLIIKSFSILLYKYLQTDNVFFPIVREQIELCSYDKNSNSLSVKVISDMQDDNIINNLLHCGIILKPEFNNVLCDLIEKRDRDYIFFVFNFYELNKVEILFNNNFYTPDQINELFYNYLSILDILIKRPNFPINKITGVNHTTKNKILYEWNNTKKLFPDSRTVHELFEDKVFENPSEIAVIYNTKVLTREQINEKANQVARYLIDQNAKQGDIIGVLYDKEPNCLISILAILKIGCSYLPIDSSYPIERIEYMINDSKINLLITKQNLTLAKKLNIRSLLMFDDNMSAVEKYEKSNLDYSVSTYDKCYVIYTSGSTGNPKGVILNHQGRVNNFCDFSNRFNINEKDTLIAVSSLSFDMCAFDFLGMLMNGGKIIIPDIKMSSQPMHWLKLINDHHVTIWHSVPVLLQLVLKYAKIRSYLSIKSLRLFLLGGDWIPTTLPENVKSLCDSPQIISLGGATEVSMDSTIYEISSVLNSWPSIPYGKPMNNQKAYVLDSNFNPLPIGVSGELYLGGVGVSDGYLNHPELTSEKFFINPFISSQEKTEYIYKTGDIARFLPDGNLHLIGRRDFQVKIHGMRIELAEIEHAIMNLNFIKEAIALPIEITKTEKKICAFITLHNKYNDVNANTINCYLHKILPPVFIPSFYQILDSIPLTPNGKINRKYLSDLAVKSFIEERKD